MDGVDSKNEHGGKHYEAMKVPELLAIDRVMEVLKKLAPVEWGRLLPGRAQSDRINYPPLIVWRFRDTSTTEPNLVNVEGKIFEAIARFQGRVKWSIQKPGRNIVLTTAKVLELEKSFRSDAETLKAVATTDPMHANEAHTDLAAIIELLDGLAAKLNSTRQP
jgi:hypothetical protein